MNVTDLRIALFSGNYNITLDGANKALNRLAEYLLRRGASLRVYSPTSRDPAFEATGDLVSLPAVPIPGRSEYRIPLGLSGTVKRDLERFAPNVLHIASPDFSSRAAVGWAKARDIAVLASVHTRFETYPRYYHLGFVEPVVERYLRSIYRRCDALVTPSQSMVDVLRQQCMNGDVSIWSRGVDRTVFDPSCRDPAWRRGLGIQDDEVAIAFLGRLVMEKGLDIFAESIAELRNRGVAHRVLLIGEGPARSWFEKALPGGIFAGFQGGAALGRARAPAAVFLKPPRTHTKRNGTRGAMASGQPVVAAGATGSTSLVEDGKTGTIVQGGTAKAYAGALARYCNDATLRGAHGQAGEARSRDYSWDAINQAVIDTYLRISNPRQD